MREKRFILILCSIVLVLVSLSCGRKADPRPKGLPVPGGINDLSGEVRDGMLFLSFALPTKNKDGSEIKDLAGFKVYKSCGSCLGAFELFKEINLRAERGYALFGGRVYIYDDDLVSGFQYAYKVYPYTERGTRGDESNTINVNWEQPPGIPRDISVKEGDGQVELYWRGEMGVSYNVYRHEEGVYPFAPLNKGPVSTPFYIDSGLENGKRYSYEVRKVQIRDGTRMEGEGFRVEATPKDVNPPGAPLEVQGEWDGNTVKITWKEGPEGDIDGYNIYRMEMGKADRLNDKPVKGNVFTDEEPPEYRYTSYHVTAVDLSGGESDRSREIIVILEDF